jgi:hypothetical protein
MESGHRHADDGAQRTDASRRSFLGRIGLASVAATALVGVAEVAGLAPATAKTAGTKASSGKFPKMEALFKATDNGKGLVLQAITPGSCSGCEATCCLALGHCGGCAHNYCCAYCDGCGALNGYYCVYKACLPACYNLCI